MLICFLLQMDRILKNGWREWPRLSTFISADATQCSRMPSNIWVTRAFTISSDVGANFRFHRVVSSKFTNLTWAVCEHSWLGLVTLFSGRTLWSCLLQLPTRGGGVPSGTPLATLRGGDCSLVAMVSIYWHNPERFCECNTQDSKQTEDSRYFVLSNPRYTNLVFAYQAWTQEILYQNT